MAYSNELERTLGKILATQDQILEQLKRHHSLFDKHIDDDKQVEKRVELIEKKLSYASGIIVASVAIFSFTSDFILTKLGLK